MTDPAIRRGIAAGDRAPIAALLEATGFFNPEELTVALELVDDALAHGAASHYRFLVAEQGGEVAGYDLYWIAVGPARQGGGVGRALLREAERWMREQGRSRCWIETSTRPQYAPTRGFYLRCGYDLAAELADYYAPGDGKAIFVREIR
jgi:GNAT superfamily N-acetyltransferase